MSLSWGRPSRQCRGPETWGLAAPEMKCGSSQPETHARLPEGFRRHPWWGQGHSAWQGPRGDSPFHHPPQSARSGPHPASPAHTPDLSGYLTEMELRVCTQPHTQTIPCRASVLPLCARVHVCVHTRTCALGTAMNRGGWAVLLVVTLSIQGRETRIRRAPWASVWTRGIAYHRRQRRNLPEQTR